MQRRAKTKSKLNGEDGRIVVSFTSLVPPREHITSGWILRSMCTPTLTISRGPEIAPFTLVMTWLGTFQEEDHK